MSLSNGKHQFPDPTGGEGVGRDAARLGVDGATRLARRGQRGRPPRLDADDLDLAPVPRRDAPDQPASPDGHQKRIEGRRLGGELETDRSLPEECLDLIEGVHGQRAGLPHPRLAGREGIGVALAPHHEIGAVLADPLDLRGRRHGRHEDLRGDAESHRGVGDGRPVIAARGGDDAGGKDASHEQVGEGPPRLERSGMLEQLQLEGEGKGRQAEVRPAHPGHGGEANMAPDDGMGRLDLRVLDGVRHRDGMLTCT